MRIDVMIPMKNEEPMKPISSFFLQSKSSFSTQLWKNSGSDSTALYLSLGIFSEQISSLLHLIHLAYVSPWFIVEVVSCKHSNWFGIFSRNERPVRTGVLPVLANIKVNIIITWNGADHKVLFFDLSVLSRA